MRAVFELTALGKGRVPDSNVTIGLFGSLCDYTCYALESLIERRLIPSYAVLYGFGTADLGLKPAFAGLETPNFPPVVRLCVKHGIAVHFYSGDNSALSDFVKEHRVDCMLLACFPVALPMQIAGYANSYCLNIHPSLLPKYRGPNPLFWQLRLGEPDTGVTVHRVSAQIDAGQIAIAKRVAIEPGLRIRQIERSLVRSAIESLSEHLASRDLDRMFASQDTTRASWHGQPCENDYLVHCKEAVQAVFRFVRAYGCGNYPLAVKYNGMKLNVADAAHWSSSIDSAKQELQSEHRLVRFAGGYVNFIVREAAHSG